jgi:hypothetical protein
LEMNRKNLLIATILALSLSVTVGVVLAWDVNQIAWGNYGPQGTRCLAGAAGNIQYDLFYQWAHWSGYYETAPIGAWSEITSYYSGQTYAYTYAACKYKMWGQTYTDSTSYIYIYP